MKPHSKIYTHTYYALIWDVMGSQEIAINFFFLLGKNPNKTVYYHHKDIKERHFLYKMIVFKNSVEKNYKVPFTYDQKSLCHHYFFHFIPMKTSSVPMPSLRTGIWDLLINLIFIATSIKTWCVQF